MIRTISGLPGKGKNVYASYLAKKHFARENSFILRFIRRIKHEQIYINNVYSNYPILLDKKHKIYSNIVNLNDLNGKYKFIYNAFILIDETQAYYDSDEYKNFPKNIAIFNQFHRHFGIKDIYYISQHPSRIVKKLRNVSFQFTKIRNFIVIPFLPIGVMYYSNYYEFDDYGKWHHPKKEAKVYDVDNHFLIFRVDKVFKSYSSRYLKVLNVNKPFLDKGTYNKLDVSEDEVYSVFGKIWSSKE